MPGEPTASVVQDDNKSLADSINIINEKISEYFSSMRAIQEKLCKIYFPVESFRYYKIENMNVYISLANTVAVEYTEANVSSKFDEAVRTFLNSVVPKLSGMKTASKETTTDIARTLACIAHLHGDYYLALHLLTIVIEYWKNDIHAISLALRLCINLKELGILKKLLDGIRVSNSDFEDFRQSCCLYLNYHTEEDEDRKATIATEAARSFDEISRQQDIRTFMAYYSQYVLLLLLQDVQLKPSPIMREDLLSLSSNACSKMYIIVANRYKSFFDASSKFVLFDFAKVPTGYELLKNLPTVGEALDADFKVAGQLFDSGCMNDSETKFLTSLFFGLRTGIVYRFLPSLSMLLTIKLRTINDRQKVKGLASMLSLVLGRVKNEGVGEGTNDLDSVRQTLAEGTYEFAVQKDSSAIFSDKQPCPRTPFTAHIERCSCAFCLERLRSCFFSFQWEFAELVLRHFSEGGYGKFCRALPGYCQQAFNKRRNKLLNHLNLGCDSEASDITALEGVRVFAQGSCLFLLQRKPTLEKTKEICKNIDQVTCKYPELRGYWLLARQLQRVVPTSSQFPWMMANPEDELTKSFESLKLARASPSPARSRKFFDFEEIEFARGPRTRSAGQPIVSFSDDESDGLPTPITLRPTKKTPKRNMSKSSNYDEKTAAFVFDSGPKTPPRSSRKKIPEPKTPTALPRFANEPSTPTALSRIFSTRPKTPPRANRSGTPVKVVGECRTPVKQKRPSVILFADADDIEEATADFEKFNHLFFSEWRYRISIFLGVCLATTDPWNAAWYFTEARANPTRQLVSIHKSRPQNLRFKKLADFRTCVCALPDDVCVVHLEIDDQDTLWLIRLQKDIIPIVLPIAEVPLGEETISRRMRDILERNDAVVDTVLEKVEFWSVRRALDADLTRLMFDLENTWLSNFRSLFVCNLPCGKGWEKRVKVLKKAGFSTEIATFLTRLIPSTSANDFKALLPVFRYFQSGKCESMDADAIWTKLTAIEVPLASASAHENHTILILPPELGYYPWENLPVFRQAPLALRTQSLHFVNRLLESADASLPLQFNAENTFYLLNPGNDLPETEKRVSGEVHLDKWEGVCRRNPTKEEIAKAISTRKLFLFIGHGNGCRYFTSSSIRRSTCQAAAILMGCSSVRTEYEGRGFAGVSVVNEYAIAGSPFVLGCLWVVTDGEIDRFFLGFVRACMAEFTKRTPENEASTATYRLLSRALVSARKHCKLRSLTSASVVAYGIPTATQVR